MQIHEWIIADRSENIKTTTIRKFAMNCWFPLTSMSKTTEIYRHLQPVLQINWRLKQTINGGYICRRFPDFSKYHQVCQELNKMGFEIAGQSTATLASTGNIAQHHDNHTPSEPVEDWDDKVAAAEGLNTSQKPADALPEYAVDCILPHVGEEGINKYVFCLCCYKPVDNTVDPPRDIYERFVTAYCCWVQKVRQNNNEIHEPTSTMEGRYLSIQQSLDHTNVEAKFWILISDCPEHNTVSREFSIKPMVSNYSSYNRFVVLFNGINNLHTVLYNKIDPVWH